MIKYLDGNLEEFKNKENTCMVIPVGANDKPSFPKKVAEIIPSAYSVYRSNSQNLTYELGGFIFGDSKNLVALFVCINSNILQYSYLFSAIEKLNRHNPDISVLITKESFQDYISNWESFEFDIEQEFKDSEIKITILA